MLDVTGLAKTYGDRPVLAGADLVVSGGEAVALVGGNGCGKTTTLRCVVGLARPDGGRILVDGVDAIARPRRALERLSYLPQRPSFPGTLTVREVLEVVAKLRGMHRRVVDREIDLCGLSPVADCVVSRLSGGERQRVGLAVAFVPDVPLLIFDEPSASLDAAAARVLIDRARGLRREGRAVLYTTHVAADIDELATRVALLRQGRVEMFDHPELCGEGSRTARPVTPGERALQTLETGEVVHAAGSDSRRRAGTVGVWERITGTAFAPARPR
jgi:ABC-type multidrug transport system ATPase subunit